MRKSMVIGARLAMVPGLAAARAWAGEVGSSAAPAGSAGPTTQPAPSPALACCSKSVLDSMGSENQAERNSAQRRRDILTMTVNDHEPPPPKVRITSADGKYYRMFALEYG